MANTRQGGSLRSDGGYLVVSRNLTGATWQGGFLRSPSGALVVDAVRPASILLFDDFDGPAGSSPSAELWTQEVGRYSLDQGGLDYAAPGAANVRLDGASNLELRVLQTVPPDAAAAPQNITSGRLTTRNKLRFLAPCRYEAKAKLPVVSGLLPSIWTVGLAPGTWTEGWPTHGEIDIAELEGGVETSAVDQYLHMGSIADIAVDAPQGVVTPIGAPGDSGFHVYGVDVLATSMRFHIDGVTTWTLTQAQAAAAGSRWPFATDPQFLILSAYAGVEWMPALDRASLPASMLIDWVKVTQL